MKIMIELLFEIVEDTLISYSIENSLFLLIRVNFGVSEGKKRGNNSDEREDGIR